MANFLDKRDRSLAPTPGRDGVDKVAKFRWAKEGAKPSFEWIRKELLNLDDRYQREARSHNAVMRIARNWDWMLCLALGVVRRADGTYWVFSGGHRVRASFYRSDVPELPCLVFNVSDLTDEARTFVAGAKFISTINSFDTFRAASLAGEPDAIATKEILDRLGIRPSTNPTCSQEIKCIHTIQEAVGRNAQLAERILSEILQIADGAPVHASVFRGLFALCNHFSDHDVLQEFQDKIRGLTQALIVRQQHQLRAEIGKGGEVIEARAILALLNKNRRSKLEW